VREAVPPLATWMMALLVLVEGNYLFMILKATRSSELPLLQLVLFLAFRLPYSLVLSIPMAYLFGVCLAISRLARDEEFVAMQAAGAPARRILAPFGVLGLTAAAASFAVSQWVSPWANRISNTSLTQAYMEQAMIAPHAGTFVNSSDLQMSLYVGGADLGKNALEDVVVLYQGGTSGYPDIWSAPVARLTEDTIELQNASLYRFTKDGTAETSGHAGLLTVYARRILEATRSARQFPDELTVRELWEQARNQAAAGQKPSAFIYEFHARFAIPCAALVFVILGVPLSWRYGRRGGVAGTLIAIALIFLYYILMIWGRLLGQAGTIPAFWGAWGQNILFGGVGLALLWRL
jgi:lipopolysaccharide export LptBFGC system permease protein LptF